MADKKKKDADAKDKGGKKEKKGKKGKGNDEDAQGASIANHPRARGSIRRVKGWAGLVGFTGAALVSLQASVPMFDTGLRALGAGVIGYMLAWWFSVMIWRQLILAEQKAAYEVIERRRSEESENDGAEKPVERPRAKQPAPAA
ncbi:MAG TPA: hypothetical protein VHU61_02460 [Solirubrobacteraceae bacterium]|jgi:hypothetical protein|nr:hypothetical protein [Solirubrobacteraceae bacterium]